MEDQKTILDPLFEKAEEYGKTSFELYKLKLVDKISDVTSSLTSRLISGLIITCFFMMTSFAVSFWLGDILGKVYYGFLCVAGFYGLIALISLIAQPWVKEKISNSIISKILN